MAIGGVIGLALTLLEGPDAMTIDGPLPKSFAIFIALIWVGRNHQSLTTPLAN